MQEIVTVITNVLEQLSLCTSFNQHLQQLLSLVLLQPLLHHNRCSLHHILGLLTRHTRANKKLETQSVCSVVTTCRNHNEKFTKDMHTYLLQAQARDGSNFLDNLDLGLGVHLREL